MDYLHWGEQYKIGVLEIDRQHEELFDRVNRFVDACLNFSGEAAVEETLSHMFSYAVEHFAREERLMEDSGYEDLQNHRKLHHDFKQKIEKFRLGFNAGKPEVSAEMARFMVRWLNGHVLREDQKLRNLHQPS